MYFWDCRSRSTLILIWAHFLHQALRIIASCQVPASSVDTAMTFPPPLFPSSSSLFPVSRWSSSSSRPSCFLSVISAISASICSMWA